MNLHVPQTEESRVESLLLLGITQNLCTPKNGEPLVTPTQDFLTTSFLLTSRDVFYDRAEFMQICGFLSDALETVVIPPPAIYAPVRLWTGKQVFSILMYVMQL
jgi:DNA-directed RNA polymerase III subunit RPC1